MKLLNNWLLVGVAAVALSAGIYWQQQRQSDPVQAQFTTINGQSLQLDQLRGKPVVVTFWATSCPSCVQEIPHWVALYQQFASQGLTIIAVAMPYDPPNQVVEMSKQRQLPYSIALDPDGALAGQFAVNVTPSSFLIDPQGRIADSTLGMVDLASWQQRIASWLSNG